MGRKPKTTDYVDKEELKELLIYWIEHNPNDDGEWLNKYEKTIGKKRKGVDDVTRQWIAKRRALYATERKWTPEFRIKEDRLFRDVYKIAEHRLKCFKFNPEEKEDLLQEIMITEVKYLNRYNELTETSAFAYITAVCNNAIKLYLGDDNASRFCRIPWNDLNDKCISVYYGSDVDRGAEFDAGYEND